MSEQRENFDPRWFHECAHNHAWFAEEKSTRCPKCGTVTFSAEEVTDLVVRWLGPAERTT